MKSIHQLDARTARAQKIRHFLYMIVFVVVFSIALSLYSQVRYHRSAAATVAEFDLRLLLASQDQNELTKKLTGMLEEGKTTYEIPSYILFDSELEIRRHEYGESSMQVFHLLPSPEDPSQYDWSFGEPEDVNLNVGTYCSVMSETRRRSMFRYLFESVRTRFRGVKLRVE